MRRLVSLALVLAIVACGSDDETTSPTNASVAGTWTLKTVNGATLPATIATSPAKVEVLGSTVTATANGTWTASTQLRTTIGTTSTTTTSTDGGTFVLNGNAVTITSNQGGAGGTGVLSGNTLTLTQTGGVFIYQKQ